jgi:hypothetical protein
MQAPEGTDRIRNLCCRRFGYCTFTVTGMVERPQQLNKVRNNSECAALAVP